jgi:hypothetical protein
LPTTTRSSRPVLRKSNGAVAVLLCTSLLFTNLLLGCATPTGNPEDFFVLTPESPRYRALQTRIFETTDERELLSASAAVLQDLGFQVEESEVEMGILRAAKERSAREFWQEFRRVLIALLSSGGRSQGGANTTVIPPVDLHQQIGATLATRPLEGEGSRFTVRVLFHRKVWKGDGRSGDQYIPPGRNWMEMIYDGEIYQQFFAKLSKGLFLEAHEI